MYFFRRKKPCDPYFPELLLLGFRFQFNQLKMKVKRYKETTATGLHICLLSPSDCSGHLNKRVLLSL